MAIMGECDLQACHQCCRAEWQWKRNGPICAAELWRKMSLRPVPNTPWHERRIRRWRRIMNSASRDCTCPHLVCASCCSRPREAAIVAPGGAWTPGGDNSDCTCVKA